MSDIPDATTVALSKLPKTQDITLLNQVKRIIDQHTRGKPDAEFRVIYCSTECLAKEIVTVIHNHLENNL